MCTLKRYFLSISYNYFLVVARFLTEAVLRVLFVVVQSLREVVVETRAVNLVDVVMVAALVVVVELREVVDLLVTRVVSRGPLT